MANLNLGSLFGKVSSDYLGVEFSSDSLRLAYIRSLPMKKEVTFLANKDTQGLSPQDIAGLIRNQLTPFKIKNPLVCFTVSSHLIITKNVEVPSQDPKEIFDIINLQASRHTPYAREEILIDYINIGTYRKSYTKILLVIVNRDIVKKHFEILRLAGFEPRKVSFSSESVARALFKAFKLEREQLPVGFVHVDTAFSDFSVALRDKVIFVRNIPMGIQHLTVDKDTSWQRFIDEIKESLEIYRNEDVDAAPGRVILTGAIDEIKDIGALLNASLIVPSEPVSFMPHFSLSPAALQAASSAKFASFLGPISAGLCFDDIVVDLTPEESKLKRLFERKSKEIIKTGILVISIFVLSCLFLAGKIYLKNIYLKKLNSRFEELHRQAEVLEKDFSRIKLMRRYLALRGSSVEVLSEIYKVIPDDIEIDEVRFDRKGVVSIKGTASEMANIFALVDELNKSIYFIEVETKYTNKRQEEDKDVADFEVVAIFSKEEES